MTKSLTPAAGRSVAAADRRVTLRDVASASDVSVSTASRCLSGRGEEYRISPETILRVTNAAERLHFRPNHAARSLRTRRSGLIGIVVPDIANPFFAGLAGAVTPVADDRKMGTLLADTQFSVDRENRLIAELHGREVEGLILCSVAQDDRHLQSIFGGRTPIVLADRAIPGSEFPAVVSDHLAGARMATRHLVEAGHTTIGYLQGHVQSEPSRLRLQGYREVLEENGIRFDEELVAGVDFTTPSGHGAARTILSQRPDVTALFAANNPIVVGALQALAESGLRCPQDVSIVAFDDHPLAEFLATPLTCVAQDTRRLGRESAELLSEVIASGESPMTRRTVPVTLVLRNSVAAPRSAAER